MNKIEQYTKYENMLNGIAFRSLEHIRAGFMLAYPITGLLFGNKRHAIRGIIAHLFMDRYRWNMQYHGGKTLVFISHLYLPRKDHLNVMEKIASTIPAYDLAFPVTVHNVRLQNLRYLPLVFSWLSQLRPTGLNFRQRLLLTVYLLDAKVYLDAVRRQMRFEDYDTVLVRMDGQVSDSAIAQTAKACGCTTITVQDGYETGRFETANTALQCQAKLRGSLADYCLAWSPFFTEIIKQTVPAGQKIMPLGMPKYIAADMPVKDDRKFFGVLLDCSSGENCNRELVEFANAAAKKYKISYILRYHPRDKENLYADIADAQYCISHERGTDFQSFVQTCDFIIGCNSSTILESLYINPRTYRMQPLYGEDVLRECQYPQSFTDQEGLNAFIEGNARASDSYLAYVCGPKNVKESYESFFQTLSRNSAKGEMS